MSPPCLCKQAEIRAMKTKAMFWKEVVDHIVSDLKSHTTPCWRSRQSRKSVVLILCLPTLLILVLPLFVFANTSWRCCVSGWLGLGAPSLLHQSRILSVVPALLPDLKPWFCHLLVAYTMCLSLFSWKVGIIAVPPEVVMRIKISHICEAGEQCLAQSAVCTEDMSWHKVLSVLKTCRKGRRL